MPCTAYKPAFIYVDEAVAELALTRKILAKFSDVKAEFIGNPKELKKPLEMTGAKKSLVLARMKADPLKEFRAMSESSKRPYYALNLISNCHLECTYCILQSYLANNPVITIYTNIDEILSRLEEQLTRIEPGAVIGSGKIADSLALEDISEHHSKLIPFFATQGKVTLELKTKSDKVDSLLHLPHKGQTVLSWSMNPPQIIEREELKTASFTERLNAAQRATAAGYRVAFHFDPMIYHEGWKENYASAAHEILSRIPIERIAWMSAGTLRFPFKQSRIMKKRFPKNESIHQNLISTSQTFIHYPDALRHEMQSFLENLLASQVPTFYRCMDFES